MNDLFRKTNDLYDRVYNQLDNALFSVILPDDVTKERIRTCLLDIIKEDITALVTNDPAARFNGDVIDAELIQDYNVNYVAEYKALQAVIDYRIANYLQYFHRSQFINDYSSETRLALQLDLRKQARRISEESKVQTAIEIHPAAQIGPRFVIDHGFGTIIGETCEIGSDCYFLQGVVLGATGVKGNENERRHPKIGNHVEIAGGVRIYGRIEIGDNSIIYGNAIVTQDVPKNSQVRVSNQIQITTPCENGLKVYGVIPKDNGVRILGSCLNACSGIALCNKEGIVLKDIHFNLDISENCVDIGFTDPEELLLLEKVESSSIVLDGNTNQMVIKNAVGWKEFVRNLKSKSI